MWGIQSVEAMYLGGSIKGFFLVLVPEGDGFILGECMMYSSNICDFEVRTFGNTCSSEESSQIQASVEDKNLLCSVNYHFHSHA